MNVFAILFASLVFWTGTINDYYQHQINFQAEFVARTSKIEFGAFIAREVWGRPDSKIHGSIFNQEVSRTLETRYGMYAKAQIENHVDLGVIAYRRGVDAIDRIRVWGQREMVEDYRYTIGYYDGLRLKLWLGPVAISTPWIAKWNDGTVPSHAWLVEFSVPRLYVDFRYGGERIETVFDVYAYQPIFKNTLDLGIAAGWPELPGWGASKFRFAFVLTLKNNSERYR